MLLVWDNPCMDSQQIQAGAAVAQVILALAVFWFTWKFSSIANRLLKLQTESQIEPDVSLDLYYPPYAVELDEPLAFLLIENHSPIEICTVSLSVEIFGLKGEDPRESNPAISQLGPLPDPPPNDKIVWCIDAVLGEAVGLTNIGPQDSSVIRGVCTSFLRFHFNYRRKSDGTGFHRKLLLALHKTPGKRPVAIFAGLSRPARGQRPVGHAGQPGLGEPLHRRQAQLLLMAGVDVWGSQSHPNRQPLPRKRRPHPRNIQPHLRIHRNRPQRPPAHRRCCRIPCQYHLSLDRSVPQTEVLPPRGHRQHQQRRRSHFSSSSIIKSVASLFLMCDSLLTASVLSSRSVSLRAISTRALALFWMKSAFSTSRRTALSVSVP